MVEMNTFVCDNQVEGKGMSMSRPGELEELVDAAIHTPEKTGTAMKHLSGLMKEYRADREIQEARELLVRSLEMLYLLGYDSSFTNPAIDTLTTDIKKFLEDQDG